MVINISIHDSVENYSCHNVFNIKNINTFDLVNFFLYLGNTLANV